MPITLGCPSCGKRFRARDESAGKKVKCPYCQAAVEVASAEESAKAGAPTAPLPTAPSRDMPPVVATPDDWGADSKSGMPAPPPMPARAAPLPTPAAEPEPLPTKRTKDRGGKDRGGKDRPKPARTESKPQKSPEQVLAKGWSSVRRGLFWVQFGVFWIALIGFVGFGKAIYERSVGPLPKGNGGDWISIDGFINSDGVNSIPVSKEQMIDLACYGLPVFFASILMVFGRLIASGGPRMSGSRGLFALSSLFGLMAFIALFATFLFAEAFKEYSDYAWRAFLILAPVAELWFLIGVTACGVALRRPAVARAVGAVVFIFGMVAFAVTIGWPLYVAEWRPRPVDLEIRLYEQAVILLGWLLMIGVYWRAVRGVRVAAREYLDTVEDRE